MNSTTESFVQVEILLIISWVPLLNRIIPFVLLFAVLEDTFKILLLGLAEEYEVGFPG